jgi:hypothetical protein
MMVIVMASRNVLDGQILSGVTGINKTPNYFWRNLNRKGFDADAAEWRSKNLRRKFSS